MFNLDENQDPTWTPRPGGTQAMVTASFNQPEALCLWYLLLRSELLGIYQAPKCRVPLLNT